ncbi:hypothetical protein [Desulfobotulus sp.]|jgi:hypothetical protein|uniref:hypothetical protein n=1 Tax=Desulfobotulus sp. TaxID=1940337 RepID=UPI002A364742|nr:hypothetical protein [Desulfobotulus sp.]MDY0162800.1 hypothetical protein [Desulfobotulus sp.]
MIQALIFKEWLKLRWALCGLLLVGLGILGFMAQSLMADFASGPAVPIWQNLVERQVMFFSGFKSFGILTGLVTALVQWLPDTPNRGLRLQFHLPFPQMQGMAVMVGCGAGLIFVVSLSMLGLLLLLTRYYFPPPVVEAVGITMLPWLMAGLPVYAMSSAALVEPHPLRKICYAVIGWQVAALYLEGCGYAGFKEVLFSYLLLGLGLLFAPFLPGKRFKGEGL